MADKDENEFSAHQLINSQRNTYALFRQKEYNLAIWNNMEGTGKHCIKWNKSGIGNKYLLDFTHIGF